MYLSFMLNPYSSAQCGGGSLAEALTEGDLKRPVRWPILVYLGTRYAPHKTSHDSQASSSLPLISSGVSSALWSGGF